VKEKKATRNRKTNVLPLTCPMESGQEKPVDANQSARREGTEQKADKDSRNRGEGKRETSNGDKKKYRRGTKKKGGLRPKENKCSKVELKNRGVYEPFGERRKEKEQNTHPCDKKKTPGCTGEPVQPANQV